MEKVLGYVNLGEVNPDVIPPEKSMWKLPYVWRLGVEKDSAVLFYYYSDKTWLLVPTFDKRTFIKEDADISNYRVIYYITGGMTVHFIYPEDLQITMCCDIGLFPGNIYDVLSDIMLRVMRLLGVELIVFPSDKRILVLPDSLKTVVTLGHIKDNNSNLWCSIIIKYKEDNKDYEILKVSEMTGRLCTTLGGQMLVAQGADHMFEGLLNLGYNIDKKLLVNLVIDELANTFALNPVEIVLDENREVIRGL